MKKVTKILLITAAVMIVLGIGLTAAGLAATGGISYIRNMAKRYENIHEQFDEIDRYKDQYDNWDFDDNWNFDEDLDLDEKLEMYKDWYHQYRHHNEEETHRYY